MVDGQWRRLTINGGSGGQQCKVVVNGEKKTVVA